MKKFKKLFLLFLFFCSCNTPKHMAKVYPKGYWMKGQYLSNHNYSKAQADSVAWANK